LIDSYRNKTLDPNFEGVFLDYLTRVLHLNELESNKQPFIFCRETLIPSFVTAYMPKNFYLLSEINDLVEEMKSNGLLSRFVMKYTKWRQKNVRQSRDGPSKLTIENLTGAFQLLQYTLSLSFVVFLIEILFNYREQISSNCRAKLIKARNVLQTPAAMNT